MKRKLALLLAAVMTLSAAPMNLFATTSNKLSTADIPASDYTLFYEPGVVKGAGEVENNKGTIEYYTTGSYLIIEADTNSSIPSGTAFDLTLENADWAFYVHDTSIGGSDEKVDTLRNQDLKLPATITAAADFGLTTYTLSDVTDPTNPDVKGVYVNADALYDKMYDLTIKEYKDTYSDDDKPIKSFNLTSDFTINSGGTTTIGSASDTVANIETAAGGGTLKWDREPSGSLILLADITAVGGNVVGSANVVIITKAATKGSLANAKINDKATLVDNKLKLNVEQPNTIDLTKGGLTTVTDARLVYTRNGGGEKSAYGDLGKEYAYELTVNSTNMSRASVEVTENVPKGGVLMIPVAVKGDDGGDIVLKITNKSSDSNITTSGRYTVSVNSGGYTTTSVSTVRRGYDTISPINIMISENRVGSLAAGSFRLTAPSGYEWNKPSNWTFTFESGLSHNDTPVVTVDNSGATTVYKDADGKTVTPGDGGAYYITADYRANTSSSRNTNLTQVDVVIHGMARSSSRVGILSITGVELLAEDTNSISASGTVQADIKSINKDIVTNQKFDIATVAEYGLVLRVVDSEIPELVSGRYDEDAWTTRNGTQYNPSDDLGVVDDYHKAARIEIRESVKESWWANSGTTLVLPEGARFLKVEFDDLSQLTGNIVDAANNSTQYANAHRREDSFITINDNVLTLNNLSVSYGTQTSVRAKIQMDVWVNLEADFDGDVDVTMSNYSVRTGTNDEQTVTIATAVAPVTVETAVSDVKIGLQYVPVADFEISETKAGNLLQDKEVWITVSDEISTDMYLASGFAYEVSEGNLKISNVTTKSTLTASGVGTGSGDAQLKFEIDRESTVASTISFSNVQVKIGRDVPYSNVSNNEDRGINLVVWGPAIAENYEGLYETNATFNGGYMNSYDLFSTPGIRAKYINVISKDTTNSTNFTNVVEVTIGNPVVLINGEEYTMPVAAYVSTASNSTMVPLRFVSYALGLAEEAVTWDAPTSTATINAGSRMVQFVSGSNYYVVNGVQVGMTSPDGLPVSAEINEERIFIPFRMLGNAFDIPVDWVPTTSTAIYNDPSAL